MNLYGRPLTEPVDPAADRVPILDASATGDDNKMRDVTVGTLLAGVAASSPSPLNQAMNALNADEAGFLMCGTGILFAPVGRVDVFVGRERWLLGNGDKTLDCYFSSDGGVTAQAQGAIVSGALLYLGDRGALLGGVTLADLISFCCNL